MGRIAAAYGIHGWLKIQPFTAAPGNLMDFRTWWLGSDENGWRELDVLQSTLHGGRSVVAQIMGCHDRSTAERYKGMLVAIPRSRLPAPDEDEYYWADLIGLNVVNVQDENLGVVDTLIDTGSNQVLCVTGRQGEIMIPFIASAILQVDLAAKVIRVDWQSDFLE